MRACSYAIVALLAVHETLAWSAGLSRAAGRPCRASSTTCLSRRHQLIQCSAAAAADSQDAEAPAIELSSLPRKQLQEMAKARGLKANAKTMDLIAQLAALADGTSSTATTDTAEPAAAAAAVAVADEKPQPLEVSSASTAGAPASDIWTEERVNKRVVVLQRKLRQVKDLEVAYAADPGSLNDDQIVKIDRKAELQQEIADMELLRKAIKSGSGTSIALSDIAQERLNRARVLGAQATAAATAAASSSAPVAAAAAATSVVGERQKRAVADVSVHSENEFFDNDADDDDDSTAAAAAIEDGNTDHLIGLPKTLGVVLSYCRVSTRETCELLIHMGRVSVNGVIADDPSMKVDILNDVILASGARVEIPPKFDNAADPNETELDRERHERNARTRRTGPLPKREKPATWKQLTKYRWNVDGGLLARKTRGIKPRDGSLIDKPKF
jgi:S4 domain